MTEGELTEIVDCLVDLVGDLVEFCVHLLRDLCSDGLEASDYSADELREGRCVYPVALDL